MYAIPTLLAYVYYLTIVVLRVRLRTRPTRKVAEGLSKAFASDVTYGLVMIVGNGRE